MHLPWNHQCSRVNNVYGLHGPPSPTKLYPWAIVVNKREMNKTSYKRIDVPTNR